MLAFQRRLDLIKYAWKDSKMAKKMSTHKLSRLSLFFDIVRFSFKYEKDTREYLKLQYYDKNKEERKVLDTELSNLLKIKQYQQEELVFHSKWTSEKWEHPQKHYKRLLAYRRRYNMGMGTSVRYNVWIRTTHNRIGQLIVGRNVAFGRNSEIDYTGDLTLGDGVDIAERTIILTHGHDLYGLKQEEELIDIKTRAYITPLIVEDNVFIGAQSIIMPGVSKIGENAVISGGSVVTEEVPRNAIVAGNPAHVIGKLPRVYYRFNKKK